MRKFDTFDMVFNSLLSAFAILGILFFMVRGWRALRWWDVICFIIVGILMARYPWIKK
jgi:hypothetical protein